MTEATIGEYHDWLDTGLWTLDQEACTLIPPPDLTEEQLMDFLMVYAEFLKMDKQ